MAENLFGNTASYEVYANVGTKSGKGGYARICQITPRDQKSNANLIAAAPELLEALEWLSNEFDCRDDEYGVVGFTRDEFRKAEAAIRKARGEV